MTVWRRIPSAVYRIYDEEEHSEGYADGRTEPRLGWLAATRSRLRPGRLLGVGLLFAVGMGALGLVGLNLGQRSRVRPSVGAFPEPPTVAASGTTGSAAPMSSPSAPRTLRPRDLRWGTSRKRRVHTARDLLPRQPAGAPSAAHPRPALTMPDPPATSEISPATAEPLSGEEFGFER